MLNLTFTVNGNAPSCSPLNFVANPASPFFFNAGNPAANTTNGQACVVAGTISGTVTYGNAIGSPASPRPVQNVLLTAIGATTETALTAADGTYSLAIASNGSYTVTPSKTKYTNRFGYILAADATAIQRARVGLDPALTNNQSIAADVNGDGFATSFDASLIQQFRVGLQAGNPVGTWIFIPVNRTYPNPNQSNLSGQDYSAILLGDVTGDYVTSSTDAPERTDEKKKATDRESLSETLAGTVQVTLPTATKAPADNFDVPVTVGDLSGMNVTSFDFDLLYDPTVIQPQTMQTNGVGTLSAACGTFSNVIPVSATQSRLAVSTACVNPLVGAGTLISLKFTAVGLIGTNSSLSFSPFIFNAGVPTNMSNTGNIAINIATASGVSVGGKVQNMKGRGVANTQITMTDSRGEMRTVRSNPFGFFTFTDVPAGEAYTINIRSKQYTFATQVVNVSQNLDNLVFTADK